MKSRTSRTITPTVALLLCLLSAVAAHGALPAAVGGQSLPTLAPMLERATPAVVNIATITHIEEANHPLLSDPFFRRFFNVPRERRKRHNQSLGSGVIVDAERGLVLTNHHVVDKADQIEVRLTDGRELEAELIGSDAETDIAVLRIPVQGLTAVPMADSDALRVGDFVVAIGSPFGLSHTATSGIVSALGRSGLGIEGFESFIQTDASINPGNSGGPLVDLQGRLVGINTAILAPGGGNVGIGFAIPVNMARAVLEQILDYGSVRRGLFGVAVQDLTPELARALGADGERGAVISLVEAGSAAEEAGLRPGDVVVAVDGKPVRGAADLRNRVGLLRIGTEVELSINRSGKSTTLRGRIADPYAHFVDGGSIDPHLDGALLGERSVDVGNGRVPIVTVGRVSRGGAGWQMGLREGDLVLTVNRERVRGLEGLRLALVRAGGVYSIHVKRGDKVLALALR